MKKNRNSFLKRNFRLKSFKTIHFQNDRFEIFENDFFRFVFFASVKEKFKTISEITRSCPSLNTAYSFTVPVFHFASGPGIPFEIRAQKFQHVYRKFRNFIVSGTFTEFIVLFRDDHIVSVKL